MADTHPVKGRLHHQTPGWVRIGAVFHVRIRCERSQAIPLTNSQLAASLLESVKHYHDSERWWCRLFLLMPDHTHALLSFPPDRVMSEVIRSWKAYHARISGVEWQDGYFDHRIRNAKELDSKWAYIRQNPVVKELCEKAEDWPWVVELEEMRMRRYDAHRDVHVHLQKISE